MASASVGDTVDIYWDDTGRRDSGTIEKVGAFAVTVRVAGPPEITIALPADRLREAVDPHLWKLNL
jgi:hypothetical protein